MSISTIPNPDFVLCTNCSYRTKQKVFNKNGRGYKLQYFCDLPSPSRQLYGQKGCESGKRRLSS